MIDWRVTREDVVAVYKKRWCYVNKLGGVTYRDVLNIAYSRYGAMELPAFFSAIHSMSETLPGVGVMLDVLMQLGCLKPSETDEDLKIEFEEKSDENGD